jgi:hypothetical protein
MLETMLQRLLSVSSLVKYTTAKAQAQQLCVAGQGYDRPSIEPVTSTCITFPSSLILASPGLREEKHIHFDKQVRQCITLETKGDKDKEINLYTILGNGDTKCGSPFVLGKRLLARNFCVDSITIAMLPSTMLKYKKDTLLLKTIAKDNNGKLCLFRSPPSMLIPYREDEDNMATEGLLREIVNTVNKAKDIAYVIWNVG